MEVLTGPDSLQLYLTGAGSHAGAQADPDASLGGYRSTTKVPGLGSTITSPISNVTVDYIDPANGIGAGTLNAASSSTLKWKAPGSSTYGPAVTIANGETKILIDGENPAAYVKVTRTSASSLTGTATVTTADVLNGVIGMDNVTSAEREAGYTDHRAIMLSNENIFEVAALKIFCAEIGTPQTSDDTQLGGSGSGQIVTTGNFDDWDESGFAAIYDNGGTLKELVYYESRTTDTLNVPANGRGLQGTSATAGANDDMVHGHPGIALAIEAPDPITNGDIQTIADEETAPTGLSWNVGNTEDDGIDAGEIAAGEMLGLWIRRVIPEGAVAKPLALHHFKFSFEAV